MMAPATRNLTLVTVVALSSWRAAAAGTTKETKGPLGIPHRGDSSKLAMPAADSEQSVGQMEQDGGRGHARGLVPTRRNLFH
jgi:hypothetical protein